MEIEQHTAEQPVSEKINQKGNQNIVNENRGTIYTNLWDVVKSVLGWKFIRINAYIKKNKNLK